MKSLKLLIVLLLILPMLTSAQNQDTTLSYNLLVAPSSPAFNLIGIEPASVERPGSVTDFATTILTRTDNLSTLPNDLSIEFAPYWAFGGGSDLTYEEYATQDRPFGSVLQTLSVSFASATLSDEISTTGQSLGVGLRFSILQGTVDTTFEQYREQISELKEQMRTVSGQVGDEFANRTTNDPVLIDLRKQRNSLMQQKEKLMIKRQNLTDTLQIRLIDGEIGLINREVDRLSERMAERQDVIMDEVTTQFQNEIEQLQEISTDELLKRTGWKLDFAGGLAWDFPDQDFDSGDLRKAGAWLNGGYEGHSVSLLGVARYLHDDEMDDSSLDLGMRLILDSPGLNNFSLSGEGVYRSYNSDSSLDDTYRIALVGDYTIAKNKKISFTFGRNFEGATSGNLLSMVNLILGFGSERPF